MHLWKVGHKCIGRCIQQPELPPCVTHALLAAAVQTFLPHREKAGATKAASPELLTKKRALAVRLQTGAMPPLALLLTSAAYYIRHSSWAE